jgi:hypothetical protein
MNRARAAAALAFWALLAAPATAQTAPPAPAATMVPWQPRPVIIIDPRHYLPSPTPRAAHRPTPKPHPTRRPLRRASPHALPTPEVFERHDTTAPPNGGYIHGLTRIR